MAINWQLLARVFRVQAAPAPVIADPGQLVEDSVLAILNRMNGTHKEHREAKAVECQDKAQEELVPILANPNLAGSLSDMKYALNEAVAVVGMDEVRDFVNHRLPPHMVQQIVSVATCYRVASDILGEDASMETKSFMHGFRKAQQAYGEKDFFATYIGLAAAVDYIQMDYELGADLSTGSDGPNNDREPPSRPRRHGPGR